MIPSRFDKALVGIVEWFPSPNDIGAGTRKLENSRTGVAVVTIMILSLSKDVFRFIFGEIECLISFLLLRLEFDGERGC